MTTDMNEYASRMGVEAEGNRAEFTKTGKSAFVIGYTGEIGKGLVKELASSKVFSKVVLIGRREVKYDDEEIQSFEQKIVDFDNIGDYGEAFTGLDVGYCCLGTTLSKAGKDGVRRVDHDYVVNSAKVAKDVGCTDFHLVTAGFSNKNSIYFQTKIKGEAEEHVKEFGFDRLSIYRPGVVTGYTREERRMSELFMKTMLKPVLYFFPKKTSIPVTSLAKAIVNATVSPPSGPLEIFEHKNLHSLSGDSKEEKKQEAKK